jgi:uncharacterized protein (TIGR03437 family)
MRLTRVGVFAGLILARAYGQSTCVSFPAGFIPFSSISYVTAADSAGDHLVVGVPAAGALSFISANVQPPASTNQTFCDAQVQLAPQQFYPNVYVPTAAELSGNFSAFAGLLVNPANNQAFQGGIIPASQLNNVFAWRIGGAQVASANRAWSPTGSMTEARTEHAAVLLPSGKVLVVGGNGDTGTDLYDPATGTFMATGRTLFAHTYDVTATLLNNGLVLLVGGRGAPSAAELYDPVAGTFAATGSPVYLHGYYHTATPLANGLVLVVGGLAAAGDTGQASSGAETYNPKTGTFTEAGAMAFNRNNHTATLLADGRVLIAGGQAGGANDLSPNPAFDSAEIYDPSTGNFSLTSPMQAARTSHFAALLASGKVLVGGGYGTSTSNQSAELFDPVSGSFLYTGEMSTLRSLATATLLSSGQVLVAGGYPSFPVGTNAAELYDPAIGSFTTTGSMGSARGNATATLLLDGLVLVTGGRTVCCAGVLASAELYTPVTEGLVTSQTGLTFRVAAGNAAVPPQSVAVLSTTASIPWTLSASTYQGGNWLNVTPTSGSSVPGATPVALTISANPAGLAAQDYYGAVTLTPTDGVHPPITIAIVLSIVPPGTAAPPAVTPSGLVFLGAPGTTLKPQTFTVSNLTSQPIAFTGTGSPSPSWFAFTPKSGIIAAGQTTSITVTPSSATLIAGVYPGTIDLLFGDGSTQGIDLLLVISATAGSARPGPQPSAVAPKATAACTASNLLPVFTTIGTGFSTPAAWPTALVVQVVDDCGAAFNTGSVVVSFSNGDSPISLLSTGSGNWAGTWVPAHSTAGFTVRADAQQLPLTGSVEVSGQVLSNPSVPIVSSGGLVSSVDFSSAPALGLLVSVFGSGLADGTASSGVPLVSQLGSTSVVLSGRVLPLLYVSDSVVNVAIPYDLQVNTSQQLVVLRGNAVSVPVPMPVFASAPSVVSASGTGSGQGLVYRLNGQVAARADTSSPAAAGDTLVIYAVGLGAVTPALAVEDGASVNQLEYTAAPATVTIGGVPASVGFAGLTPGYPGLYQVNATMPGGVTPGTQVPVKVSVAGKSSQSNIFIAVQ